MNDARHLRIRALLAREASPHRSELLGMLFEAVIAQPIGQLVDRDALRDEILHGLAPERSARVAERHVLPALDRLARALLGRAEVVRDLLSDAGEQRLTTLVRDERHPRFAWLQGALDPADVRELITPIIQQQLMQFASKLPIPGLGGGGLGGLVGRLGKQVGQLADVGRSMLSGVVRDFSQSATSEFRVALAARIESPDGQRILARMRDRALAHLLAARLDDVVCDLMQVPREEVARLVSDVLAHGREQALVRSVLEIELDAQLETLAERTPRQLLEEFDMLDRTRAQVLRALDPVLRQVMNADPFADWLARLLADADAS